MPTRFLKDIPNDQFVNILIDTSTSMDPDFVVGSTYNVQAVGSSNLLLVEFSIEPALTNPGIVLLSHGAIVSFIVQTGLGIWIRSTNNYGTAVFNDEGV